MNNKFLMQSVLISMMIAYTTMLNAHGIIIHNKLPNAIKIHVNYSESLIKCVNDWTVAAGQTSSTDVTCCLTQVTVSVLDGHMQGKTKDIYPKFYVIGTPTNVCSDFEFSVKEQNGQLLLEHRTITYK